MSNGRDRCTEAQANTLVDRLREHNLAALDQHLEAADDARLRVVVGTGQVLARVDRYLARDVVRRLALEDLNLVHDHLLVFADSLFHDLLDEADVLLAAANDDGGLHELDESLKQQVLQQLLVGFLVVGKVLLDLVAADDVQLVDVVIDLAHLHNPLLVLLLGFLDFELNLLVGQIVLERLRDLVLFSADIRILLDGELVEFGLLDPRNFLLAVLLDEVHHVCEDLVSCCVRHIEC